MGKALASFEDWTSWLSP